MQHRPVRLQNGEYKRGHTRDEELRNDNEDVVNALLRAEGKEVRAKLKGFLQKKDRGRRTRMIPALELRPPRSDLAPPF